MGGRRLRLGAAASFGVLTLMLFAAALVFVGSSSAVTGFHGARPRFRGPVRTPVHGAVRAAALSASSLSLARQVGQLIIGGYFGTKPPALILREIRAGQVGAILLYTGNTDNSVTVTRTQVRELQAAARAGHNPGLLIMTDQEGGEVKRLAGPPAYPAARMSNPRRAAVQGYRTALMLKRAGVNVDLAPVADVTRTDGFLTQEERTFGSKPAVVAAAACSFASGLARGGVAYTLKHFPGLGDASANTDTQPVNVTESAADIYADDLAYRRCGSGPLALVMISSAAYQHLTGKVPAVLSSKIYSRLSSADDVNAVLISDSLTSASITPWKHAAVRALDAGLDMVMYQDPTLSPERQVFEGLLSDARNGSLPAARLSAAVNKVLTLKAKLKLG